MKEPRTYKNLMKQSLLDLRRLFLSGLVSILPLALTFYAIGLVFNFTDRIPREIIARIIVFFFSLFNINIPIEEANIPGLGLITSIFIIMVAGYISANWIGKGIIRSLEIWFLKIPIIGNIYTAFSQIMDTIFTKKKNAFKDVVLLEYPYRGCYAIGFITTDTPLKFKGLIEKNLAVVFVPTTPNPTSGFMLMMEKNEIYKLNISVEEAIKMVVSGGILAPYKFLDTSN
ncbi:MAG: DUF502 domain-containing protein [Epulopiscium sp.]|nr:DUF502 domain-containing protein [Candidatus Epulonipiscium sp.]